MGVPRRLTKMQRAYAFNIVNRNDLNQTQCALEAGYAANRVRVTASELQNPNRYPLVVKYIEELRERKFENNRLAIGNILEEFYYLLKTAKEHLQKDLRKGKYHGVHRTLGKFKEVFDMIGYRSHVTVYLAEEARPYYTGHYKIGKTLGGIEQRSTGMTDNPFGLNYVATFEYFPRNGLNLEKTFHNFFRHYSTYNEKYNTSSSEWFSLKNRKTMINTFRKVGTFYLYKNQCMHTYINHGENGFFKKSWEKS